MVEMNSKKVVKSVDFKISQKRLINSQKKVNYGVEVFLPGSPELRNICPEA